LKDNYMSNRIGNYGSSTFYHGSIYITILYIFSKLVTDIYTTVPSLFIFLIMIPFTLVMFNNVKISNVRERNFRRIVSYLFLLLLVIVFICYKFFNLVSPTNNNDKFFI